MGLSLTPRAAQMLYSEHPYDSYLTRLACLVWSSWKNQIQ